MNIAERLHDSARRDPWRKAVVFPHARDSQGRVSYTHLTFQQLDRESDRLARGLQSLGVARGTRLVLMVRPSLEFIALTFALFKAGAIVVLIDPGMGRSNIFRCLELVEPEGFVAIPLVHWIRRLRASRFPKSRIHVTLGARSWGNGVTYQQLLGGDWTPFETPITNAKDPAAIIFTSGSTGPPKGVVYEHGMFDAQVDLLRDFYQIERGEVDLPAFPLFALFNAAMGVTTVIPDMDPTKPARVNPERIIEAVRNQGVTQAFGSPAFWKRVGNHCVAEGVTFPSLRRGLSAGAPVPWPVLESMSQVLASAGADMHTPYGATESLPVASISSREVMNDTAAQTRTGRGTCVGKPFPRVDVKILKITATPLATMSDATELPPGEIGEIVVRSPSTTREYFRLPEATAMAKIADGNSFWHRMGDVGYRDETGRLWFCGRKAHIVPTSAGPLYTECIEPVFNVHRHVYRTALVGVKLANSTPDGSQRPVIIVEPEAGAWPGSKSEQGKFLEELRTIAKNNPLTQQIETFLFHRSLPVDIRHNVKIFREKLAPWAEQELAKQ